MTQIENQNKDLELLAEKNDYYRTSLTILLPIFLNSFGYTCLFHLAVPQFSNLIGNLQQLTYFSGITQFKQTLVVILYIQCQVNPTEYIHTLMVFIIIYLLLFSFSYLTGNQRPSSISYKMKIFSGRIFIWTAENYLSFLGAFLLFHFKDSTAYGSEYDAFFVITLYLILFYCIGKATNEETYNSIFHQYWFDIDYKHSIGDMREIIKNFHLLNIPKKLLFIIAVVYADQTSTYMYFACVWQFIMTFLVWWYKPHDTLVQNIAKQIADVVNVIILYLVCQLLGIQAQIDENSSIFIDEDRITTIVGQCDALKWLLTIYNLIHAGIFLFHMVFITCFGRVVEQKENNNQIRENEFQQVGDTSFRESQQDFNRSRYKEEEDDDYEERKE